MIIKTRDFGNIEVKKDDIIKFACGMYGFEEYLEYIILKDKEEDDIMYLQSIQNENLSFILIDPYVVINDYKPYLDKKDLEQLHVEDESELKFLIIAIIKEEIKNSIVNLKSPIAINAKTKEAKQVILDNLEYPLRYPLFKVEEDDKC